MIGKLLRKSFKIDRSIRLFDVKRMQRFNVIQRNESTNNQIVSNSIIVTKKCLERIEKVLDSDEILRVEVRGGGCSGFEYNFSVNKKTDINKEEDLIFEKRVVIDSESLQYLHGSKVDFEDELIRSGFCIKDNPYADQNCSCGVSFSLRFDKKFDGDKNEDFVEFKSKT
ncbi:hypothetical protein NH340_JMT03448 [Sarcoptes scabiei]|nr:hypothetical protein NH340_JMT03448 [Sarcoptes scabiei]